MDLIEQIGAFLGLAAFLALAVLILLYFQQARDVRRLREWAGRAPERAEGAAEAAAVAAAEEAGVAQEDLAAAPDAPPGERPRARLPFLARVRERLPAPRYLVVIGAGIAIIAAGVATGGFGLLGEEKGGGGKGAGGGGGAPPPDVTVAVLNGTGVAGSPGVEGLAETVAAEVKKAGYQVGNVTDAGTSFTESLVMYEPDDQAAAEQVAGDLQKQLGKTDLLQMSPEIEPLADGAPVAIVIGQDDSQL